MNKISILILFISLSGCFGKDPQKTGLEGKPLPTFNLFLADSMTYLNTSTIPSGKPIALLYFGPNCPYSRAQIEEIINHNQSLQDIQFYVFTISSFQEMKQFYHHYQLNKYPNIKVGVDYKTFFSSYFEIPGVPFMAIYGKDRRLNKAFIGQVSSKQIKSIANE